MTGMESPSTDRHWVIYRERTIRQVFTGIEAATRAEAMEKWYRGDGEIQPERETERIDAVDVRGEVA